MPLPDRYETLRLSTPEPHLLLVELDRPEAMNALNTRMGRDLLELWTRLTEDPEDLRCVVLTGTGERAFCAGGDLKERNGMTDDQWRRQHEVFERQHWTLADLPLPVIASVCCACVVAPCASTLSEASGAGTVLVMRPRMTSRSTPLAAPPKPTFAAGPPAPRGLRLPGAAPDLRVLAALDVRWCSECSAPGSISKEGS
jgi:hypothetical protein